jgi:hypothetical protein
LARKKDTIVRKTLLDFGSDQCIPEVPRLTPRLQLTRWGLSLSAAEAKVLGASSANEALIAAAKELKAFDRNRLLPKNISPFYSSMCSTWTVMINPKEPSKAWISNPWSGWTAAYVMHSKGASIEELAAKFKDIRSLIQAYGLLGGGGLSGVGSPAGSILSALCAFFDEVVKLYCYSTLMLNQVNEGIEKGDFDVVKAKEKAARLCEFDAKNFAKNIIKNTGKAFVTGTVENLAGGAAADAINSSKAGKGLGSTVSGLIDAGSSTASSGTSSILQDRFNSAMNTTINGQ